MANAANQAIFNAKRNWYMEDSKARFNEYYLWLSDWIGLQDSIIPATPEEVRASKDEHLNDIALYRWDRQHWIVTRYVNTKGIYWSLSDTVCCLKAMARRRNQQEKT